MAGALTHDPITPGGGLHQTPSGGVQTGPDGLVRALTVTEIEAVAAQGFQASTATYRTMQDAANIGGLSFTPGTYSAAEPILLGSNTSLNCMPGAVINGSGTYDHNFARVGNADYLANAGIPGVWIICATQRASYGEGLLTFTLSGTTLAWRAPGDATSGTGVDISSVVSTATCQIFTLTSSGGDQLHVVVINSTRSGSGTAAVRVEPITGAKAITYVRNGSTFVATETGHARKVGDLVMVFGAPKQHGYITAATADTWTLPDTAGASSGSAQAFGVRNISIQMDGATINGNQATLSNTNNGMPTHAFVLFAASNSAARLPEIAGYAKYGVLAVGCADTDILSGSSLAGDTADTVHITGPHRGIRVANITAKAVDNIVGIGCCDYKDYAIFFPANGTVDVSDYNVSEIRGVNTTFELVRLYNANTGWLRNGKISGVRGTYSASTSAAVTVISDANASQVDAGTTNIDGLDVEEVTAIRDDGTHSPAFHATGTGTRRGVRIAKTPLRACNIATSGTFVIDSIFEDLSVRLRDGNTSVMGRATLTDAACGFSGGAVQIRGAGRVKHLTLTIEDRLRGNNQLPVTLGTGSADTPCVLRLEAAASQVDHLTWVGGVLDDISSSGTKIIAVRNVGVITLAEFSNLRQVAGDAFWRQLAGSNAATQVYCSNVDVDALYMFATDVALAVAKLSNCRMRTGTGFHLGAAGTYRIDAAGCTFDARFVRNAAGASTVTVRAVASSAGTPLQVDAGSPSIRLGGDWDMSLDGALLDTTVANHAPGAKFYNTSAAAFGAVGVGALVRGSAAFTRVAA